MRPLVASLKRRRRTLASAAAALSAMAPPPRLSVAEWAELRRVVPHGTSPEAGRWRSKPYQRPVLEAISDPRIEGVLFVAASQGGGKTEIILNAIGHYADADPSPILVVEPTLEMAEALSKDRISPMIRETPELAARIRDPRSRDSGNTLRHKVFPGGHLTLVGANSASGLAMRPIRVVLFDEIDRYPASAGSEGDPVQLAETRSTAFWNARKVYATSPGLKGLSRSWGLWRLSDRREWHVPCPDCGHAQILSWAQVSWTKDEEGRPLPETAVYVCERCGSEWNDAKRWKASAGGAPRATNPGPRLAGFRLSALAVLGRRLEPIVRQWLAAQGNPELLKVFVNTVLAEWWEDPDTEAIDEHVLLRRREDWRSALPAGVRVPRGPAVLTAGIDVQADRLELEVVGWGRGEESWSLDHRRIFGDVRTDPNVFADLERALLEPWRTESGHVLYVRAALIDTGHATQEVYRWAQPRFRRILADGRSQFLFAGKGRSGEPRPVWTPAPSKKKHRVRINLWTIGVDAAKEQVYARLGIATAGPGYCHFPLDRGQAYFEQLTAEHAATRYRMGRPYRAFELRQKGRPNEALDCRVYAYAALVGIQAAPFGLVLEHEVERILGAPPPETPAPGAQTTGRSAPRTRRRRSRGVEI